MPISIRGDSDPMVEEFAKQLREYDSVHPKAQIELYRHNPYSIRVRVIDDAFRGMTKSMRHDQVWPILNKLSEDTLGELSFLVLIPPEEKESAISSREFDHPVPSTI
jgi:stress-induced morphogen